MDTVKKRIKGRKNELWQLYLNADAVRQFELRLELKRVGLLRHWHDSASAEGYTTKHAPYPLRDIFLKLFPESKPFFPETFEEHHETKATQ